MTSVPPPVQAPQVPVGVAPHRGTTVLVLGIVGIVCCVICGIIAWVMGGRDLKLMNAGQMDPAGRGTTNAGRILGIIGVVLGAISVVLCIIALIVAVVTGASFFALITGILLHTASNAPAHTR